jgi:hypothetical protein
MFGNWWHWLKGIVVATAVSLVMSKVIEWCLPEKTLEAIVHWEKAQLSMLGSISPWELAARFGKLMQQHPNESWLSLPHLALIDLFTYADGSFGSIVLLAEVAIAAAIVWESYGSRSLNKAGILAVPPIALGIVMVACVVNVVAYASYALVLSITLPLFQLGVLALGGGTAAGTGWAILQNGGFFAAKVAEHGVNEALTKAAKRAVKLD